MYVLATVPDKPTGNTAVSDGKRGKKKKKATAKEVAAVIPALPQGTQDTQVYWEGY